MDMKSPLNILRLEIATQVLAAMMTKGDLLYPDNLPPGTFPRTAAGVAKLSLHYADALLKELSREE